MGKRTKESRKRINSLILLIAFTAILLITSTYAWFTTQKSVSINELKGKVEVAEGLQISLDADTWGQEVNFGSLSGTRTKDATGFWIDSSNENVVLTSAWGEYDRGIGNVTTAGGGHYVSNNIRPVLKTDSNGNAIDYNTVNMTSDESTGYLKPVSSACLPQTTSIGINFFEGTYSGTRLRDLKKITESDEAGFFAFDMFLLDMSKEEGDPAHTDEWPEKNLQLNFNSIVSEIKAGSTSKDFGMKNTMRVALAKYGNYKDLADNDCLRDEVLEKTMQTDSYISSTAVWEPNADAHSSYIMTRSRILKNMVDAADGDDNTGKAVLTTYAIKNDRDLTVGDGKGFTNEASINDVYVNANEISGVVDGATQILAEQKTVPTNADTYTGLLNGREVDSNGKVTQLKDTGGNDFKIHANKITRFRVYVWMEGQDPDCINWTSQSEGVEVVIGLCKDAKESATLKDANNAPIWVSYDDRDIAQYTAPAHAGS